MKAITGAILLLAAALLLTSPHLRDAVAFATTPAGAMGWLAIVLSSTLGLAGVAAFFAGRASGLKSAVREKDNSWSVSNKAVQIERDLGVGP
jgi:hypothetical protein